MEKIKICEIVNLVIDAANVVLDVYNSIEFGIEEKQDKTPLTIADKASHKIISTGLYSMYPHIPILSEEGKDISYNERKDWKYFWLVDPLDGTKEFIKRNGEFTVNVALIKEKEPLLGVIVVPVKSLIYFAVKGLGAYKVVNIIDKKFTDDRKLLKASVKLPLNDKKNKIYVVGSSSHKDEETEHYIEILKKIGNIEVVSLGSSLKLCAIAEGVFDVYPRFGPTMEWDIAAGQIIVEEAGGVVVNAFSDTKLIYNKESLVNPPFIAKGASFLDLEKINETQL